MKRYIDADALSEKMFHKAFEEDSSDQKWDSGCWIRYHMFEDAIESIPTADVRENVHAKWLPYKYGTKRWHKCSACGIADEYINEKGLEARREFCPHCGAQMEVRK